MAVGEKLIYDVYVALRSNQTVWEKSLLIVTYDEHGGNYDHVPPDTDATPPDEHTRGPDFFDFTRFGVRVPAVVVSPMIPAGTVFRAPAGSPPYDHTSIIATLRARFELGSLGKRDAVAPHLGPILSLAEPRGDDPLEGVTVPTAADPALQAGSAPIGEAPSSFLEAKAIAAAELPVPAAPIENPEQTVAGLSTAADQYAFIQDRLQAWEAAGKPLDA
jgi:phospholipase C